MSEQNDGARREVPEALERALAAEISLPARMRHAAVGLAGLCGAGLITVLWATEPVPLPTGTQVAFGGLIAVGLAWAVFAAWALTRRRPLFARDRVLGARLAVTVTTLTCVCAVALAAVRGATAVALGTAVVGVIVIGAAGLLLVQAQSRRRELLRLRAAFERDSGHHE